MHYIGIDIGKSELVIANPKVLNSSNSSSYMMKKCVNEITLINAYLEEFVGQEVHFVLESTGKYGYQLVHCLTLLDLKYSLLNPKQSNGFVQSMKVISQNDERDAILLSLYGQKMTPEPTISIDDDLYELRQKRQYLSNLKKYKQVIDNQLHAMDYDPRASTVVKEGLHETLANLVKQIEQFEQDIYYIDDEEYKIVYDKIIKINGIGKATANAMILATNGFKDFSNAKKVSKYVGLAPASKDSGTSVRIKGKIVKTGEPILRSCLYMASISAKKYNNACKELYDRLRAKGKPFKVAIIAVANKLIKQAFTIIKNNTVFDNNFAFAK